MRFPLCMNFTIPRDSDGTGQGVGGPAAGPGENGPDGQEGDTGQEGQEGQEGEEGQEGPEGPQAPDPFDGTPNNVPSFSPDSFDDPFEGMYNPVDPPTVPGIETENLPALPGGGIGV
jgi:hypothetical protein